MNTSAEDKQRNLDRSSPYDMPHGYTDKNNENFLASLITLFKDKLSLHSVMHLMHSQFFSPDLLKDYKHDQFKFPEMPSNGTWQFIFGDFPFGVRSENPKIELAVVKTIESLKYLSEDGIGFYILSGYKNIALKNNLRELLAKEGAYINAIINLPKNFYKPYTSIRPILIIVSKKRSAKEFILQFESTECIDNVNNFFNPNYDSKSIHDGIWMEPSEFKGFINWELQRQLSLITTDYAKYETTKLSDITSAINSVSTGGNFQEIDNCVYVPKIGHSSVLSNISDLTLKHQNYYQLIIDVNKIDIFYMVSFFNSTLGKFLLESIKSGDFIPIINKTDIKELQIATPPLHIQKEIAGSIMKLNELRKILEDFESNLSLNPISSKDNLNQIDLMFEIAGKLSKPDKIKSLIRNGETETIEYKASLSLCMRENIKKKEIEDMVIKTIAAFLNSDGGDLLVGVQDDGSINGLNKEIDMFHKSNDKFMLHFKNLLQRRIGEHFYPLIHQELVDIDSKLVLLVNCKPSDKEVFVDGEDFYVRTNPATDKLTGAKQIDYIKRRFKN